VFNFNPRWLALAIAQMISISGAYATNGGASDYLTSIATGFFVYLSATGATCVAGQARKTERNTGLTGAITIYLPIQESPRKRKFSSPWFWEHEHSVLLRRTTQYAGGNCIGL